MIFSDTFTIQNSLKFNVPVGSDKDHACAERPY